MIGRAGTDYYWMRLGPVEMGPLLQAHIHVRLSLEGRLRIVYVGHEFLRRPNPKARWTVAETVRIPLDPAAEAQITTLVMYGLWSILLSGLSVESITDQAPFDVGMSPPALLTAPEEERVSPGDDDGA